MAVSTMKKDVKAEKLATDQRERSMMMMKNRARHVVESARKVRWKVRFCFGC